MSKQSELDEILHAVYRGAYFDNNPDVPRHSDWLDVDVAKERILDWQNKQIAIAQERAYHASIQSIEMLMRNEHEQRNKLKESKDDNH